jgi:hypothetical protein
MTGYKRQRLDAEWIERLWRFQKRSGNATEFCRAEVVSMAILYRWRTLSQGSFLTRGPRCPPESPVSRFRSLLCGSGPNREVL